MKIDKINPLFHLVSDCCLADSLDAEAMSVFVKLCHVFLEDHYHSSPYKLAEDDHVIRSAKAFEMLCKYHISLCIFFIDSSLINGLCL
jgi:hypothetical protein